jgi:deoxyribodipyrimidine photolyase-related protein
MLTARQIILVLGDQLSPSMTSLQAGDPSKDVVLIAEVQEEARYVRHHKKKIAFLFAAMRHFAEELRALGWRVVYRTLNETGTSGSLVSEVSRLAHETHPERVILTEPSEWRLRNDMQTWSEILSRPVILLQDHRFICSIDAFGRWARGRKRLRMEYFYREMRQKTGLLMSGDKPEGGKWNYDRDNRKRAPSDLLFPGPYRVEPDAVTRDVIELVEDRFPDHFGDVAPFWFAVTRGGAEAALAHFISDALPQFGTYQDAMLRGERFLFHSVLSPYINCGLLDPLHVCRQVEAAYRRGRVPINAAEGFIRQIIGWREYVRGIYWLNMPDYRSGNHFGHNRTLPSFYWTGVTKMECLRAAITQTKEDAYAHHIQRLMVTGNFALLAGVSPQAVHEWYLAVYADAYEWVELPNTLGMSQFSDGGILASKPYVASGAYINRMSDYCSGCRYDVRSRTGDEACPFNVLYWDFLARHRGKLARNPRMAQMYRTMDRFSAEEVNRVRARAAELLSVVDEL